MLGFENFLYYLEGFKNLVETGDVLSKKERLLLEWCNYLSNNTKFKNIALNNFNNVTFKSGNRAFKLEINEDYTVSLTYCYRFLVVDNGKCKDYSTSEDMNESTITGDFYKLRNWFKKRNYLKG